MTKATMAEERILTLHPEKGKQGTRIAKDRYDAMRKALLAVIPKKKDGVAFGDLKTLVPAKLRGDVFEGASVTWYLVTVKLDLEARGEIERVPGRGPQRVRRT